MSPDDHTPEDPLPALRAEIDQMMMTAPVLAEAAAAFYNAYKTEGFSETQAIYLTAVNFTQNAGKAP